MSVYLTSELLLGLLDASNDVLIFWQQCFARFPLPHEHGEFLDGTLARPHIKEGLH